ncbi:MAG: AAA family ATPase [Inquilinus sp.]|nr:AAA family ATPase [Inquilinus sp.]
MNGVVEQHPAAMTYDQAVDKVRSAIEEEGLTQAKVAKELGIAASSLSQILNGSYQGSKTEMGAKLGQWLARRNRQHRATAVMPALPNYIETPTAVLVRGALDYAHLFQDISVVFSGAGLGKTTAAREYARRNTGNVFQVTVTPDCASAPVFLQEVGIALGLRDAPLHPAQLRREIVRRLRGSNGLLIVDEAQHLTVQALEAARSIHDLAEVGMALLGNAKVYERIHGANRQREDFAQIFSRIGRKLKLVRPKRGDIHEIAKGFGVEEKAAVAYLETIAEHPGALRGVVKTIRLAFVMAVGQQSEVRLHHLKAAWHNLQGDDALPAE